MMQLDPVFPVAGAMAVTMLLGAAAVHKLAGLAHFRAVVADYRLLPPAFVAAAAVGLPLLELVAAGAAMLFAGNARGLAPAAAMLLLYAGAMTVNLMRGRRHIDCGCTAFGASGATIGWPLVNRNIGMALGVLLLAAAPESGRKLGAADVIALIGFAAALPALYLASGEWRALRLRGIA